MDSLPAHQRVMLDLEARFWPTAGAKDDAIRALGYSPIRWYQQLNQLLFTESALAYDPVTVNRLRRIRSAKRQQVHSSTVTFR